MSLIDDLVGLASSDKANEALELANKIKAEIKKSDDDLNAEQSRVISANAATQALKDQLSRAATMVGATGENLIETLEKLKSSPSKEKPDEVLIREVDRLKAEIAQLGETGKQTEQTYKTQLLMANLQNESLKVLPKYNAKEAATSYILDAVASKATIEEGKIRFKNEDGTSMRTDGRDTTVDDVVQQMHNAEKAAGQSMFFDFGAQKSGPNNDLGGTGAEADFIP